MGNGTFSSTAYESAKTAHGADKGRPVTERAEQKARETGKLHPLVDPRGLPQYGPVRLSKPRFEQQPNGLWLMTIGTPIPMETRVDTTGSMGGNVDVAMEVLPKAFELVTQMLPGCDLQVATGIFGDARADQFVLCRPQFEMEAHKIVEQLTLMVPERNGGDTTEDPDYGIFAGAYLTRAYANRIGLKGYDFTVSDADGRGGVGVSKLLAVFGEDVFERMAEIGHKIDRKKLPDTKQIVQDLLTRAHAFFLQVGNDSTTRRFWTDVYGADRVVALPDTRFLPHVQATIVGLTEGTLGLSDVAGFLKKNGMSQADAGRVAKSVANIPIGAQAALPNYSRRPKAGDLFKTKEDLWPLTPEELSELAPEAVSAEPEEGKVDWL